MAGFLSLLQAFYFEAPFPTSPLSHFGFRVFFCFLHAPCMQFFSSSPFLSVVVDV